MAFKVYLVVSFIFIAEVTPLEAAFWEGTPLNSAVEKIRSSCEADDSIACFQYKAFAFLDTIFQRDNFYLSENVEVTRNQYHSNGELGRADNSLLTGIEEFIKSHDVKFDLPLMGSVKIDSRRLDNGQIDVNLNFGSEARKKSKLKKIFIPILVFILLKAITLVPFAIGILGLKAWNGLQLAFFSFIISTGLAIFQMCQKLAADSAHAHIAAVPGPWEAVAARNLNNANKMAYSAYA